MIEFENKNLGKLVELIDTIKDTRFAVQNYFKSRLKGNDQGITFEMLEVLTVLSRNKSINQQQIADTVRKNKANLTPIIDKLSSRNLVIRSEDVSDRRNKLISLTEEGKKLYKSYANMFEQFYQEFLNDIDTNNLDKTIHVLRKIEQQVAKSG